MPLIKNKLTDMKGNIIFIDDSIINWIGTGLCIFIMLLTIFFCSLIAWLKTHPAAKKKMYTESEWKKVPSHIVIFLLVGILGIYGFWWEITRIDKIETMSNQVIVLKGIFGNRLAEFLPSEITDFKREGRSHKTGSGKT